MVLVEIGKVPVYLNDLLSHSGTGTGTREHVTCVYGALEHLTCNKWV